MSAERRRSPVSFALQLIVGLAIALGMIAATAVVAASALVRSTETGDTTLTGPIERVEVHVRGAVEIRPGPADRARVVRRSELAFERPRVRQQLVDGVLTIDVDCAGFAVICDNEVTLTVPPDVDVAAEAERVQVTGMTGAVTVGGESADGGGSVELTELTGPVSVRLGAGAVIGRDLRSDRVDVRTAAGAVELGFAEAPTDVRARTGAGYVEVVVPADGTAYRVDARAEAGDRTVSVPTDPEADRVISATTGAGEVVVRAGPS